MGIDLAGCFVCLEFPVLHWISVIRIKLNLIHSAEANLSLHDMTWYLPVPVNP